MWLGVPWSSAALDTGSWFQTLGVDGGIFPPRTGERAFCCPCLLLDERGGVVPRFAAEEDDDDDNDRSGFDPPDLLGCFLTVPG